MKVAVLTSDQPRHRYFANCVAATAGLALCRILVEGKGDYYRSDVEGSDLVARHFQLLREREQAYFGDPAFPDVPLVELERGAINRDDVLALVADDGPRYLLLFGTGILGPQWLRDYDQRIINLHLGMAPYYRGAATLFWPIAMGELECVGATIHLATGQVDAGPILAHTKPDLSVGDDYYDINYKTVRSAIEAVPGICLGYAADTCRPVIQPALKGRLFRKRDFNEDALRRALMHIGDGLSQAQIDRSRRSRRCDCLQ